jgi:hypothetical protein
MSGVSAVGTVDELLVKLALVFASFIASNENYRLTLRLDTQKLPATPHHRR